ncbi:hypothetical protein [Lamprobacter modestohalophilus]
MLTMMLNSRPLDEIQTGMVIGADVYDPNGLVLLRAGTMITERTIRALKCWGIAEAPISISGETVPDTAEQHRSHQALIAMLDAQFALSNLGHPVIQALYGLCLERAQQQQ